VVLCTGQADIIKLLLASGAAVDQTDATGCTALIRAAMFGQVHAVRVLTSHGADVTAQKTNTGLTALICACAVCRVLERATCFGIP